jgi:hypothetical protein
MRKYLDFIVITICFVAAAGFIPAQTRKAGLWQVSSTTTFQHSDNPADNSSAAAQAQSPNQYSTIAVCLTQSLIDTYGVVLPPSLRDCQLTHPVQQPNSFAADLSCKGTYNGTGSIETTWSDPDHAVGKIRFVAKTNASGEDALVLRWTQESSAVFKSSDCGTVKPRRAPPSQKP